MSCLTLSDPHFGANEDLIDDINFALTRALRARRARPQSGLFSCFAAARAACVSTWLGETSIHKSLIYGAKLNQVKARAHGDKCVASHHQTLPGLPRRAQRGPPASGRFAEGKTPQRRFDRNVLRQASHMRRGSARRTSLPSRVTTQAGAVTQAGIAIVKPVSLHFARTARALRGARRPVRISSRARNARCHASWRCHARL